MQYIHMPSKPVKTAKKSTQASHSSSQQSNVLGKGIVTALTDLLQKVLEKNDKVYIEQILSKAKQVTEEELKVTVSAKKGTLNAYDRLCEKNFDFKAYFDDDSYTALKALIDWCKQSIK